MTKKILFLATLATLATVSLWAQPTPIYSGVGGLRRSSAVRQDYQEPRPLVRVSRSGDDAEISPGTQNQEGSVAIAKSVRPTDGDATLSNFTRCALDLKGAGVGEKDAIKACTRVAQIMADVTKRVANEAADATKSSRPTVFLGRRYGSYY